MPEQQRTPLSKISRNNLPNWPLDDSKQYHLVDISPNAVPAARAACDAGSMQQLKQHVRRAQNISAESEDVEFVMWEVEEGEPGSRTDGSPPGNCARNDVGGSGGASMTSASTSVGAGVVGTEEASAAEVKGEGGARGLVAIVDAGRDRRRASMRQEFETFQAELEAKLEAKFEADFEAKFEAKFETLNAKFATNAALVERTVDVVEINEVAFRTASGTFNVLEAESKDLELVQPSFGYRRFALGLVGTYIEVDKESLAQSDQGRLEDKMEAARVFGEWNATPALRNNCATFLFLAQKDLSTSQRRNIDSHPVPTFHTFWALFARDYANAGLKQKDAVELYKRLMTVKIRGAGNREDWAVPPCELADQE